MKQFARLYEQLDRTTKTSGKIAAMVAYFSAAAPADAAWAVYFLSGRRRKRLIQSRRHVPRATAVEPEAIDEGVLSRPPEHSRPWIARLRLGRDRPDLDEAEAQGRQRGHPPRVLVTAGREAQRVLERESPHLAR